jgi:alpha-glucosidase
MKINMTIFSNLIGLFIIQNLNAQNKQLIVSSPDHHISYNLKITGENLIYTISRNGKAILGEGSLGLIVDDVEFSSGKSLKVVSRWSVNQTYPTRGIHSKAINKYNGLRLRVNGSDGYEIEVRVFNDGAAFKYILSCNKKKSVVNADLTSFNIPPGSTVWSQDNITTYEGNYQQQRIENVKDGQIAGPPITIKLPWTIGYASITEAGLIDFAGMSMAEQDNNSYTANMTGITHKTNVVESPWRVILIGKTLNELVNSDVIANLSPKPDPKLFFKRICH